MTKCVSNKFKKKKKNWSVNKAWNRLDWTGEEDFWLFQAIKWNKKVACNWNTLSSNAYYIWRSLTYRGGLCNLIWWKKKIATIKYMATYLNKKWKKRTLKIYFFRRLSFNSLLAKTLRPNKNCHCCRFRRPQIKHKCCEEACSG